MAENALGVVNPTYPDLNGSTFPYEKDNFDKFMDPSLEQLQAIQLYYQYKNSGNLEAANQVLEDNPRLKQCVINAKNLNQLRDAILALERFYLDDVRQYLVDIVKPMGEWSPLTKYVKYNVVNGEENRAIQTYICMSNHTPIGTSYLDTNYWVVLTMRGEKGEPGSGCSPQGAFTLGKKYYVNDLVAYENCLWYALADNTNVIPNRNSSTWQLFMQFTGDLLKFDKTGSTLMSDTLQNAIIELDRKIISIKNVILPKGGFTNNIYTYQNKIITSYQSPDVRFSRASIPIAAKANIIVETFDGYMTFTAKKLPTADLTIDVIILTKV